MNPLLEAFPSSVRAVKRARLPIAILLSLLMSLPLQAKSAPLPPAGAIRVGDFAPDFTLQSIGGNEIHLKEQLGNKPVLLVFWSYFCFPCQKEIPGIQSVFEQVGKEALSVIGISLDGPEYDDKVRPFLDRNGITYPNVYDKLTTDFFEVAERFGVIGTPTSFLLDSNGRVRLIHLGRLEPEVLKKILDSTREQAFCPEIIRPNSP